ncbi:MAG: polysaccharide biosynthesis/export family protein [Chthoniobacteraceae bacterium]
MAPIPRQTYSSSTQGGDPSLQQPVGSMGATGMMTQAADIPPSIVADPSRELSAGDSVTFSIAEDNDQPLLLRVTDTGELDIPYIGRVSASGKTCARVAADIKSRLEAKYYNHATVNLGIVSVNATANMGQIFVSGCVRVPGPQPFYAGQKLTVSAVILKAGGFTQFGDSRKVKVTRKSSGSGGGDELHY